MRKLEFLFMIVLLVSSFATCQSQKYGIDMPILIKNGHIRTPTFRVKHVTYWVELFVDVNKDMSWEEGCCIIGTDKSPGGLQIPSCSRSTNHRLHVTWKLLDGVTLDEQKLPKSSESYCLGFEKHAGIVFLGNFLGGKGKSYVLDLDLEDADPEIGFGSGRLLVWQSPGMYP
jgi:hypothetical protein